MQGFCRERLSSLEVTSTAVALIRVTGGHIDELLVAEWPKWQRSFGNDRTRREYEDERRSCKVHNALQVCSLSSANVFPVSCIEPRWRRAKLIADW
jgi:hypothetical protein